MKSILSGLPLRADDSLQLWAIGAVYAMALLAPFSTSMGQLAQLIMLVVAVIFLVKNWSGLKSSPLLWLTIIFVGYVLLRGTVEIFWGRPELRFEQWEGLRTWVRVGLLPTTIFGLALVATGNWQRHALGALAALFISSLLYMGLNMSPDTFFSALSGSRRYYFELVNPLVAGLKIGSMFMGLLLFAGLIFKALQANRKLCWTFVVLGLFTMVFLGAALVATEARSAWFAFLLSLVVVSLIWLLVERESILSRRGSRMMIAPLAVLILMVMGVLLTADKIENRWEQVSDSVVKTIQIPLGKGELQDLPKDSVGIRVALQALGWDLFLAKPLFGYGPADPRYLQVESPELPIQLEKWSPSIFHNAHIDLLLRLGLTGYVIAVIFIVFLTVQAWKMIKTPGAQRVMGLYFVGFAIMTFVWALGNQSLDRFILIQLYSPIFGAVCAGALARQLSR